MLEPKIPSNELQRLAVLDQVDLLDTIKEERFDRITRLVKQCFGVDIVLISLVDSERQWFKSRQGLDAFETPRNISFCGHAILDKEIFEVNDAAADFRFYDNPLVTGAPFIRFYAGVPLVVFNQRIGTLCIIDKNPRHLSQTDKTMLTEFAELIEQEILDRLQEQAHHKLVQSEVMYRSVLDGTRIGTWQWNVQTGETVFNERWAEIAGYTLDELAPITIETWGSLAHPQDMVESGSLLERHFTGELDFYDFRCRMKHKQGHWVWVHDRGRVISWTEEHKPLMMYGTHADISDQVISERELRDSRDQFQTLVDNIPGITYRCKADADWTMIYMSNNIDPLSGYPASDFIYNAVRSYASVIHPDDQAALEVAVAEALKNKSSWTLQYRILHIEGYIQWVEERGHAEYDNEGNVRFLDGFILDISKEKQLQQQLIKLTEQIPGMVYQFRQWPNGRSAFPYASIGIRDIYDLTADQVVNDASAAFAKILPEDLESAANSIDRSRANLSVWNHEYRVKRDDGRILWLAGHATPEQLTDGSVLWHGYISDITETKKYYLALEKANDQLQMAQQRLELSSQQAQIGYWQASLKTGELWWSPMIYDLFGFNADEITPTVELFKSTLHPDDHELVEQSEERAKVTGLHDVVHRVIRSNGEVRWVHELAQMLPEEQNPDLYIIGSIQDVTERMRLQQLKEDFVSTVSHELRTPLTSISGALQLLTALEAEKLSVKGQKLLDVASSNSKKLRHLINDLLDIDKLIAGKMAFDIKTYELAKLLATAIADNRTFADKYGVSLELVMNTSIDDICVDVDEYRFQQILSNLLSNAIKYSNAGECVDIVVEQAAGLVSITVVDYGEGIEEEFKNRIFQRFSQADASSSKEKGGTGLGLALCKELAEHMNGEIGYESTVGVGSKFFIRLSVVA